MAENVIRIAGTSQTGGGNNSCFSSQVISLELNILGEKIEFDFAIDQTQVKLSDIVPVARTICQKITDIVLKTAHNNNEQIPCCKGCSACCSHYLVPLSVPEVFRLKDDIIKISTRLRESIWEKCLQATRLILDHKPPELFVQQTTDMFQSNQNNLNSLSNWYSNLNISCPFLSNGLCKIYQERPLVCREHYIKGPATACGGGHAAEEVLDIPIQMPVILSKLASEFEETDIEAVILPLALIWCEENNKRSERTWPAEMLIRRFVEIIQEMAGNHSKASAGEPEPAMHS